MISTTSLTREDLAWLILAAMMDAEAYGQVLESEASVETRERFRLKSRQSMDDLRRAATAIVTEVPHG